MTAEGFIRLLGLPQSATSVAMSVALSLAYLAVELGMRLHLIFL
jgi:hypothetical protein